MKQFIDGPFYNATIDDELKQMCAKIYDEEGDKLRTFEMLMFLCQKP